MRNYIFVFILIAFGLVEAAFLNYFSLWGIKPDLLLIAVVMAGLIFRARVAVAVSIFAGFMKDAISLDAHGVNVALFALWSLCVWYAARKIPIDDPILRTAVVAITALIHNITAGLTGVYLGQGVPAGIFLRLVIVGFLYTTLISPLVGSLILVLCPARYSRPQPESQPW